MLFQIVPAQLMQIDWHPSNNKFIQPLCLPVYFMLKHYTQVFKNIPDLSASSLPVDLFHIDGGEGRCLFPLVFPLFAIQPDSGTASLDEALPAERAASPNGRLHGRQGNIQIRCLDIWTALISPWLVRMAAMGIFRAAVWTSP